MKPRNTVGFFLTSHVWLRRASCFMALLTILASLCISRLSYAAIPGGSYGATEECVKVHDRDFEQDGQHFAIITLNVHAKNCQLRNAYRLVPVLGDDSQPLSEQDWLRSAYAANQGRHPTVHKGCIPLSDHRPPAGATTEEKLFCKDGLVNYYGIMSDGWRAYIYIPTTQWFTEFERKAAVAEHACNVLQRIPNPTDDIKAALDECHKKHITPAPVVTEAPADDSAQAEPPPKLEDVPKLKQALAAAQEQIGLLSRQLEETKLTLRDELRGNWHRGNVWLVTTIGLGLVLAGGGWRNRRAKQALRKQVSDQDLTIGSLKKAIADSDRIAGVEAAIKQQLVEGSEAFNRRNKLLGEAIRRQGAINKKRMSQIARLTGEVETTRKTQEDSQATHMLVVRRLRESADAEATSLQKQMVNLGLSEAAARERIQGLIGESIKQEELIQQQQTQIASLELRIANLEIPTAAPSLPPPAEPMEENSSTVTFEPPSTVTTQQPSSFSCPAPAQDPSQPLRRQTMDFPAVRLGQMNGLQAIPEDAAAIRGRTLVPGPMVAPDGKTKPGS